MELQVLHDHLLDGGASDSTTNIDENNIKIQPNSSGSENITELQNVFDSCYEEIKDNEVTQWTTVLDGSTSESTMNIDGNHIKIQPYSSGSENITDIQNFLDSFYREIKDNEVTQVTTDGNSVENAYFIDQNVQYNYQTATGDGQMVMAGDELENENEFTKSILQIMDDSNENMDNVTQIVLPSSQDKMKTDLPQTVALGDGTGYETVTLFQGDNDTDNYDLYVVKQNDKSVTFKVVSMDISQDDPDINNVYDLNDGKFPTQKKSTGVELCEEDDKVTKLVPKKSQTVTQMRRCNYCNYTTDRSYLFTRHIKSHSKERPNKCTVCERDFKSLKTLNDHIQTHTRSNPHQCRSCPSTFTTSGNLARHVRYKHTVEKPHKCTICDYSSVELSKMRNHLKRHTGERPYQCPHCTYGSVDRYKLKRHLGMHIGERPYECDICSSRFTQYNGLKIHRLTHSSSREKLVFKCDYCPVTCGRKSDLRVHVKRFHTSDEPVKCKRCGDAFPDKYQCKVHERKKCCKCKDTSIPTSETGVVAVEGNDGQKYVVHEVIELDGQDQIDDYTSSSVSKQQVNQNSSPSQKDHTALKPASLSNVIQVCGYGVENCIGFDDDETTNSSG